MHFLLPIPGKRDTNWRYTYVLFCVMNKPAIKYPSLLFNHHFFKQNGLTGVFDIFEDSPYQVIQAIYPNQFQPWEFSTVLMNFWKNKIFFISRSPSTIVSKTFYHLSNDRIVSDGV
jgi:hypothetical protein